METPVEWVLLWDVSQRPTCTSIALWSVSPGARASYQGLTGFRPLFTPLLDIPPFVNSHL
jgi:hypothetical protein